MSLPQLLYYAHAALCLALAALLSWQALRGRRGRVRAMLRLGAGLTAAAALWLTAFPPVRQVPTSDSTAALLLTEGYHPDTLRHWQRRLGAVPVLRYGSSFAPADSNTLRTLPDLSRQLPALRTLHVLGQGIPAADLPLVDSAVRVVPHPQWPMAGFRTAAWPSAVVLGDAVTVEGYFAAAEAEAIWLRLAAQGAPRDSVRLPGGSGRFRLRYRPRTAGPLLLHLSARRGGQQLAAEPVPVLVQPPRPLRILLLAGSPSFEFNLLKNHLAQRGHAIGIRLQVGRNLRQTEFLNQPAHNLASLTTALLARYDVLVTDEAALTALSATESRQLTRATAAGLGLLLLPVSATLPRNFPQGRFFTLRARPSSQPARLQWPAGTGQTTLPVVLTPHVRLRPLVAAAPGNGLAAAVCRYGLGQTAVAAPTDTYRWLLANQTATYDSYWSQLLSAVARPEPLARRWHVSPWPRPHAPLRLELITSATAVRSRARIAPPSGSALTVALRQQPAQPFRYAATFWPDSGGWHRVQLPGQPAQPFYVFGPHDWAGPATTAAALAARQRLVPAAPARRIYRPETFPAVWFFALFVLAAGVLWLEEKL